MAVDRFKRVYFIEVASESVLCGKVVKNYCHLHGPMQGVVSSCDIMVHTDPAGTTMKYSAVPKRNIFKNEEVAKKTLFLRQMKGNLA